VNVRDLLEVWGETECKLEAPVMVDGVEAEAVFVGEDGSLRLVTKAADEVPAGWKCVRCWGSNSYCVDCGSSDCVCPEDLRGELVTCDHDRGGLVKLEVSGA
jgi:hypothetical protein